MRNIRPKNILFKVFLPEQQNLSAPIFRRRDLTSGGFFSLQAADFFAEKGGRKVFLEFVQSAVLVRNFPGKGEKVSDFTPSLNFEGALKIGDSFGGFRPS